MASYAITVNAAENLLQKGGLFLFFFKRYGALQVVDIETQIPSSQLCPGQAYGAPSLSAEYCWQCLLVCMLCCLVCVTLFLMALVKHVK